MKTFSKIAISAVVLASTSVFSNAFAQGVTRAEVYADLVRVEQAGYNPAVSSDTTYPADIQAAEAKISAQDGERTANSGAVEATGVGGRMSGSSASGIHTPLKGAECVGPVSFCNLYAGS
ncbi:DUF4148 domain-containing protein [Paraburkholderia phenazinium]|uniref:DUF4148 domain-containing protein n=1 Tax=Paraburkholderia phenazinium TaxID=60549 RepID=A0A1G8GKT8_9BURK|nr:DUF4148 domain-containing protein [Paraburkholderia phenazinium]SDH94983.1 protein of unknown function [Paraburkholderia phenazinium]